MKRLLLIILPLLLIVGCSGFSIVRMQIDLLRSASLRGGQFKGIHTQTDRMLALNQQPYMAQPYMAQPYMAQPYMAQPYMAAHSVGRSVGMCTVQYCRCIYTRTPIPREEIA